MIIDEFITLLTWETKGEEKAKAFSSILDGIESAAAKCGKALVAAAATVGAFSTAVAVDLTKQYEWAKSVGVSSDSLQRFKTAASVAGGSIEDIQGDLQQWARFAEASGQSLEDIFLKEAKSVESLSDAEAQAYLSSRGYSQEAIKMLRLGHSELQDLVQNSEVIPEDNLKDIKGYVVLWRKTITEFQTVFQKAVAGALPALKEVADQLSKFLKENKELIKTAVANFFTIVAQAVKKLAQALFAVINAIKPVIGWLEKLVGKETMMKILSTLLAGVIGIILTGGVIRFVRSLLPLIETIRKVVTLFSVVSKSVFPLFRWAFTTGGKAVLDFAGKVGKNLVSGLRTAGKAILDFGTNVGKKLVDAFATGGKAVLDFGANLGREVANGAKVAGKAILDFASNIGKTLVSGLQMAGKAILDFGAGVGSLAKTIGKTVLNAVISAGSSMVTFAVTIWSSVIPALGAAATAAWTFTAALLANPVTWIVVGIVALIAAIVALIYYWDEVCAALTKVWDAIKAFGKALLDALIAPFRAYWEYSKKIISAIIGYAQKLVSGIKAIFPSIFNWVRNKVSALIDWFLDLPIVRWIRKLFSGKAKGELEVEQKAIDRASNAVAKVGPGNVAASYAQASPTQISNSSKTQTVNIVNNNTVNTSASTGPAIAHYLASPNRSQKSGYAPGTGVM